MSLLVTDDVAQPQLTFICSALKAHIKDAEKRRKDLTKKRDEIARAYRSTGESVADLVGRTDMHDHAFQ